MAVASSNRTPPPSTTTDDGIYANSSTSPAKQLTRESRDRVLWECAIRHVCCIGLYRICCIGYTVYSCMLINARIFYFCMDVCMWMYVCGCMHVNAFSGAEALRKKVQSVARLMRVFRTLRQQNELIVQLKGITPGHRIPPGALLQGEEGLKNGKIIKKAEKSTIVTISELQKFQNARKLDLLNERRPEQ